MAVIEDLELKERLYQEVGSIVTDDCIIASNTSSLPNHKLDTPLNSSIGIGGSHHPRVDSASAGSQSSRYQSDDGFIVNDEEEDAVEASADAEFSDEEPPARALRTGHMSREAARAAVDSPSFLNGLGDAAGASDDEDEEEEEEPIRRKRPRR